VPLLALLIQITGMAREITFALRPAHELGHGISIRNRGRTVFGRQFPSVMARTITGYNRGIWECVFGRLTGSIQRLATKEKRKIQNQFLIPGGAPSNRGWEIAFRFKAKEKRRNYKEQVVLNIVGARLFLRLIYSNTLYKFNPISPLHVTYM
jgi:hypothetical protein